MVYWKNRLDIIDLIKSYENGELEISELGKKIAERIRQLELYKDEEYKDELEEIAYDFEHIETADEYDNIADNLYNFGDQNHTLWIATKF